MQVPRLRDGKSTSTKNKLLQFKILDKSSRNILVTCHNARDERNLHLLGFRAEGRQNLLVRLRIGDAQVENLTDILFANGTTLLTCHSTEVCQTHIFWGFGMTGACTEGERFKARKLDSHTFGH